MPSRLDTELCLQGAPLHYCYHFSFKCASQGLACTLFSEFMSCLFPSESPHSKVSPRSSPIVVFSKLLLPSHRLRGETEWTTADWAPAAAVCTTAPWGKHRRGWRWRKSRQRTEHFLGFPMRCQVLSQGVTEMGSVRTCIWNVCYRFVCYSLGLQLGTILRGSGNFRKDGESKRLGTVPWQCLPPAPPVFAQTLYPTEGKEVPPQHVLITTVFCRSAGPSNYGLSPLKWWAKEIFPPLLCSFRCCGHSYAKVTDTERVYVFDSVWSSHGETSKRSLTDN